MSRSRGPQNGPAGTTAGRGDIVLFLADRLCMALSDRLDADIWTADQALGGGRADKAAPLTHADPGGTGSPRLVLARWTLASRQRPATTLR